MLKILGICGSPRKKATYTAMQAALKAAEEEGGVETELIELRARKLNFCIHCNKCLKENARTCSVFDDDMTPLYEKVYECDALLVGSPVYEMNITAQLATFFDRFRPTWVMLEKDPYFFTRKVGAGLVVGGTRHGGQEAAMNAIFGFYHTQGFTICNGVGAGYPGACLWAPGDGGTPMDDEYGMETARGLGKKLAYTAKLMNGVK